MEIRNAIVGDIPSIQKLINKYAQKGLMLPRSLGELYEATRNFIVAEDNEKFIGCAALYVVWEDLAEIKSVAVEEGFIKRGIGSALVKECLQIATKLCIPNVFVLTYNPHFFHRHGFVEIQKSALPHKIWSECIKCVHFPECNEVPLMYYTKKSTEGAQLIEEISHQQSAISSQLSAVS